jgi:hypothetical protein
MTEILYWGRIEVLLYKVGTGVPVQDQDGFLLIIREKVLAG